MAVTKRQLDLKSNYGKADKKYTQGSFSLSGDRLKKAIEKKEKLMSDSYNGISNISSSYMKNREKKLEKAFEMLDMDKSNVKTILEAKPGKYGVAYTTDYTSAKSNAKYREKRLEEERLQIANKRKNIEIPSVVKSPTNANLTQYDSKINGKSMLVNPMDKQNSSYSSGSSYKSPTYSSSVEEELSNALSDKNTSYNSPTYSSNMEDELNYALANKKTTQRSSSPLNSDTVKENTDYRKPYYGSSIEEELNYINPNSSSYKLPSYSSAIEDELKSYSSSKGLTPYTPYNTGNNSWEGLSDQERYELYLQEQKEEASKQVKTALNLIGVDDSKGYVTEEEMKRAKTLYNIANGIYQVLDLPAKVLDKITPQFAKDVYYGAENSIGKKFDGVETLLGGAGEKSGMTFADARRYENQSKINSKALAWLGEQGMDMAGYMALSDVTGLGASATKTGALAKGGLAKIGASPLVQKLGGSFVTNATEDFAVETLSNAPEVLRGTKSVGEATKDILTESAIGGAFGMGIEEIAVPLGKKGLSKIGKAIKDYKNPNIPDTPQSKDLDMLDNTYLNDTLDDIDDYNVSDMEVTTNNSNSALDTYNSAMEQAEEYARQSGISTEQAIEELGYDVTDLSRKVYDEEAVLRNQLETARKELTYTDEEIIKLAESEGISYEEAEVLYGVDLDVYAKRINDLQDKLDLYQGKSDRYINSEKFKNDKIMGNFKENVVDLDNDPTMQSVINRDRSKTNTDGLQNKYDELNSIKQAYNKAKAEAEEILNIISDYLYSPNTKKGRRNLTQADYDQAIEELSQARPDLDIKNKLIRYEVLAEHLQETTKKYNTDISSDKYTRDLQIKNPVAEKFKKYSTPAEKVAKNDNSKKKIQDSNSKISKEVDSVSPKDEIVGNDVLDDYDVLEELENMALQKENETRRGQLELLYKQNKGNSKTIVSDEMAITSIDEPTNGNISSNIKSSVSFDENGRVIINRKPKTQSEAPVNSTKSENPSNTSSRISTDENGRITINRVKSKVDSGTKTEINPSMYKEKYQGLSKNKSNTGSSEFAMNEGEKGERKFGTDTYPKNNSLPKEAKGEVLKKDHEYFKGNNKKSIQEATRFVEENDDSYERWLKGDFKELEQGADSFIGLALAEKELKNKNYAKHSEIIEELSYRLTEAGRTIQAAAVYNKQTPQGYTQLIQKRMYEMQQKVVENSPLKQQLSDIKKKLSSGEISESEYIKFCKDNKIPFLTKSQIENSMKLQAQIRELSTNSRVNKKQIERLSALRNKELGLNVPKSLFSKVQDYRYMSMLFNPKTLLARNPLSSATRYAIDTASNPLAVAIDKAISKKTGIRTRWDNDFDVAGDLKKAGSDMLFDYKNGVNTNSNTVQNVKFDDNNSGTLKKSFKFLMEAGDRPFANLVENSQLRGYMKENGITDINDVPDYVLELVSRRGAENGFQGKTKLASRLQELKKGGDDNIILDSTGKVVDATMPFLNTNINILADTVDRSGLGFIDGGINTYKALSGKGLTGKYLNEKQLMEAQKNAVDKLTKATIGTGMTAGSYALNKLYPDKMTDEYSTDKEVKARQKELGMRENSINAGDYNVDLSQLTTVNPNILLGKYLADNGLSVENYIKGTGKQIESALESSPFQGLQQFASDLSQDGYETEEQSGLKYAGINLIGNYANQFVPSIIKQTNNLIDPIQRNTYDKNPATRQYNNIINGIPGLSQTLEPKITGTSEEALKYPNMGKVESAFNTYLNPFLTTKNTELDRKELSALTDFSSNKRDIYDQRTDIRNKESRGNVHGWNTNEENSALELANTMQDYQTEINDLKEQMSLAKDENERQKIRAKLIKVLNEANKKYNYSME